MKTLGELMHEYQQQEVPPHLRTDYTQPEETYEDEDDFDYDDYDDYNADYEEDYDDEEE